MRLSVAAMAATVSLALCSTANAVELVRPDGEPSNARLQAWAQSSKMPLPEGRVVVREVSYPRVQDVCGLVSMSCLLATETCVQRSMSGYDCQYGRFEMWLLYQGGKSIFTHEMGHVFDYVHMNDRSHRRFGALLGGYNVNWDLPPANLGGSQRELFAEAYRLCATNGIVKYDRRRRMVGILDYNVSTYQHNRICRTIQAASVNSTDWGKSTLKEGQ